jgi:hypothetical protein
MTGASAVGSAVAVCRAPVGQDGFAGRGRARGFDSSLFAPRPPAHSPSRPPARARAHVVLSTLLHASLAAAAAAATVGVRLCVRVCLFSHLYRIASPRCESGATPLPARRRALLPLTTVRRPRWRASLLDQEMDGQTNMQTPLPHSRTHSLLSLVIPLAFCLFSTIPTYVSLLKR